MMDEIAAKTGGKVMIGPLKGLARIFQKVHEDNGGDYSRVLDLCRSSLVFDNVKQILQALEILWAM